MINRGQCFIYHFSDMADDFKGYFYTGLLEKGDYIMCEMLPAHKINPITSFMRLSVNSWNEGLANGRIKLI